MRNYIVITLLFIFPALLFSKDLKVYEGLYVDNSEYNIFNNNDQSTSIGNVTYQYYENEESKRIFHGFFKIKEKKAISTFQGYFKNLDISGQYSENYKNGIWKISALHSKDYTFRDIIQLETSAEYLNGKLHGNCLAKGIDLKSKKTVFSSTATFKNNKMIGKYLYSDITKNIEIIINFDDNGLYDGDYIVKFTDNNINYEDKRKYQNGVLQSELYRNMNNGNILYKYNEKTNKNVKIDTNQSYFPTLIGEFEGKSANYGQQWDLYGALIYWTIEKEMPESERREWKTGESLIYIIQKGIDIENLDSQKEETLQEDKISDS